MSGTVRNCPGLLCHLREPWHRTSLVCINQTVADRGLGQCCQRQSPHLLWSLISPLRALITVSGCIHQRGPQGLKHQPSSAPARPCTAPVRQLSMLLGGGNCFTAEAQTHFGSVVHLRSILFHFFPYIYLFERVTHIRIHTSQHKYGGQFSPLSAKAWWEASLHTEPPCWHL